MCLLVEIYIIVTTYYYSSFYKNIYITKYIQLAVSKKIKKNNKRIILVIPLPLYRATLYKLHVHLV